MTGHTEGPWKVGGKCADWDVGPPSGVAVATTQPVTARRRRDPICIVVQRDKRSYGDGDPELDANVRLIAAAPDMLAALKMVSGLDIFHEALRVVDAAIAKAEGR